MWIPLQDTQPKPAAERGNLHAARVLVSPLWMDSVYTVHEAADTNERLTHTHIPESLRCLKTQIDNFNLVVYGAL